MDRRMHPQPGVPLLILGAERAFPGAGQPQRIAVEGLGALDVGYEDGDGEERLNQELSL